MKPLEQELKNALRRQSPPAEFTERVMARIASAPATDRMGTRRWPREAGWRDWFRLPVLRWASALSICLMLVLGVAEYRHVQATRRRDGEMARAQVMLALRIASAKLNGALREVKQADNAPRDRATTKM